MTDTTRRDAELRTILLARQLALRDDMHNRIREGRTFRPNEVGDEIEHCDNGALGDIELSFGWRGNESPR